QVEAVETAVARLDGHRQFRVLEAFGERLAPVGLQEIPQGDVHAAGDRCDRHKDIMEPDAHGNLCENGRPSVDSLRNTMSILCGRPDARKMDGAALGDPVLVPGAQYPHWLAVRAVRSRIKASSAGEKECW